MPKEETVVKLKKRVWVSFVLLCLISMAPLMRYKIPVKASSVWTVDDNGPANFSRIQDAIYNDSVSSGDTIFVHNGTYTENIEINKSLSLVGEDVDSTIINGNRSGNVVSIFANSVSFTGFTVKDSNTNATYSGIYVERSSDSVVSHNNLIENANGISLDSCDSITISNNTVSSSLFHGIFLSHCGNCAISENLVFDNREGIYVYSSNRNAISDNVLPFGNAYGLYFSLSYENVASGNNVSSSYVNGIDFSDSNNNTIYHNNLSNNTIQASSYESSNFWDYSGEGNFWSDYAGQDRGDGIGYIPYDIDIDSLQRDNYPLMGACSDFKIVFQGETYLVSIISNSTISEFVFEIGLETRNRIIRFNATGPGDTNGFCRIAIPTDLMQYPYIMLVGNEEVTPTLIGNSNDTHVTFYFSYSQQNATIRVIASEALRLYNELLISYTSLQTDFYSLNLSYTGLLSIYDALLENYSELQRDFGTLNESYQQIYNLNVSYYELLNSYSVLQTGFDSLNASYVQLLNNYAILWTNLYNVNSSYSQLSNSYLALQTDYYSLNASYYNLFSTQSILSENYTQLQASYNELNNSYQQHLQNYSEQTQNIQSLIYIIIVIITVFIITTIYLSRQAYKAATPRNKTFVEEEE